MPNLDILINKRDELRLEWRDTRNKRLFMKKAQMGSSLSDNPSAMRREYIVLKKKQKILSKEIRHLEKKIVRRLNEERSR